MNDDDGNDVDGYDDDDDNGDGERWWWWWEWAWWLRWWWWWWRKMMMVMEMMFMVDCDGYDDGDGDGERWWWWHMIRMIIITITIVCGEANQDYTLQHYSTNYLSIHLRQSYVLPVVLLYAELQ